MRRARVALSGLVLAATAVVAAAPPAARAEGSPDLLTLQPSLDTTLVVDDNPNFARHGGDTAFGAWMRPRLEVGYDTPELDLGADLGIDVRRYAGYEDSLNDAFEHLSGWAEYRVAPDVALRVADAWVPRALRLGRPEDETQNLVQTNQLDASVRHWRSLGGERELELGAQGRYAVSENYTETFTGGAVDSDFHANYAGGLGYAELRTPLAAGWTGFVRAQGGYRVLRDASNADHADVGGSLGVRRAFRGGSLELGGGGGWLGFAGLPDRTRALGRARLQLDLPGGFVSTVTASQLLSANLEGRRVLQTDVRLALERWFGRRTAAAIAFFGTRYDDRTLGSVDLFGGAEVEVRRQLMRSLQLVARYRYWGNAGHYSSDDFAQNRGTLEFRFAPAVQ